MTRTMAGLVALIIASSALALAQASSTPRNDLPQPYKTTRDWGPFVSSLQATGVRFASVVPL